LTQLQILKIDIDARISNVLAAHPRVDCPTANLGNLGYTFSKLLSQLPQVKRRAFFQKTYLERLS